MNCLDSSLLLDLSDADRESHQPAVAWLERRADEPQFAPTFVLYEVLRGVARAQGVDAVGEAAADLEWLEPLALTRSAAVEAARIDGELHSVGQQINAADRLIAGIVRNVGGTLVTRDRDFERVSGLDVEFYG